MARHDRRGHGGKFHNAGHPLGHGKSGGRHHSPDGASYGGAKMAGAGPSPDDAIASTPYGGTQGAPPAGGGGGYGGAGGAPPSGAGGGDGDADDVGGAPGGMSLGGLM